MKKFDVFLSMQKYPMWACNKGVKNASMRKEVSKESHADGQAVGHVDWVIQASRVHSLLTDTLFIWVPALRRTSGHGTLTGYLFVGIISNPDFLNTRYGWEVIRDMCVNRLRRRFDRKCQQSVDTLILSKPAHLQYSDRRWWKRRHGSLHLTYP